MALSVPRRIIQREGMYIDILIERIEDGLEQFRRCKANIERLAKMSGTPSVAEIKWDRIGRIETVLRHVRLELEKYSWSLDVLDEVFWEAEGQPGV